MKLVHNIVQMNSAIEGLNNEDEKTANFILLMEMQGYVRWSENLYMNRFFHFMRCSARQARLKPSFLQI